MRRALALLALAWCWTCAVAAQAPLQLGTQDSYDLGPHVAWLEDATARLTLEELLEPAQQARFRAARGDGPAVNFGLTRLGLAIVRNAVEMHRGTIAVESRLGAGTTFTVRLT